MSKRELKDLVMDIKDSLFEAEHICLAPIQPEGDAVVEAQWTQDSGYLRLLDREPARPSSPERLKKHYEHIEKSAEEAGNLYYFTIRLRADDRLVGFARLFWIQWTMGRASIQLGIGDPQQRGKGYGGEALSLLVRFAFSELNLYHLSAALPEYNPVALRLFQRAGFVEEACQRQALYRDGRRWGLMLYGLLRDEWSENNGRHLPR
jgi:RimJ/RimL family protein N-acetyltransferase